MIGLLMFHLGLQGQKVNVEDLIKDSRGAEQSTMHSSSKAVTEYILPCTHTQRENTEQVFQPLQNLDHIKMSVKAPDR